MITIRTLLRSPDGVFYDVGTCDGVPSDLDYIEGAIELRVDGVEIIGKSEWDYVDQLWAYIANMMDAFRTQDEVSTYFPDQPILLALERKGGRVLVSCKTGEVTRRASAGDTEFRQAVRTAGREFFEKMTNLARSNASSYEIALSKLTS